MYQDNQQEFSFWKNLVLICIFFTITPIALLTSLFSLVSLTKNKDVQAKMSQATVNLIVDPKPGVRVYASLPNSMPSITETINSADARPELVKQYLDYYGSPLVPYAKLIVDTADKYSLDFRLITAIAQQESNLCRIIPPGSHNCWGWGIHSESNLGFSSYQEGIETVSQGLKENYIDEGLTTPPEIMSKYTPASNGSWANGVSKFMSEMQ